MRTNINLKSLKLQNFATFTNQTIEFGENFNAIVGETGSGKSLILDALQMCFGHRADKKLVRKDSEFASIETIFSCNHNGPKEFFDDIGFPFEGEEIVIKRIIYANGKSKSYLNFQACPLSTLALTARNFIDLVGQFENQKLLSTDYQLQLLDDYSNNEKLIFDYQTNYTELQILENQFQSLNANKQELIEKRDYLEFQINELKELSPIENEERVLKEKKEYLVNFEQNIQSLKAASFILSESDNAIVDQLNQVSNQLMAINYNCEKLEDIKSLVEDFSFDLSRECDKEAPEENIEELLERLDFYQRMKRKYDCTANDLVSVLENFENDFSTIDNFDEKLNSLQEQIMKKSKECHQVANLLHEKRVKAAKKISRELTQLVRNLKMHGATINFSLSKSEHLSHTGNTQLSFLAETNPGEGFHPIKDVASGGELSRILLSVRQVLSQSNSISVFLFDEIDTGVGGETALAIGKSLAKVSTSSQVIAITHLPQIAHFSDQLILVKKESHRDKKQKQERTISQVNHVQSQDIKSYVKEMVAL